MASLNWGKQYVVLMLLCDTSLSFTSSLESLTLCELWAQRLINARDSSFTWSSWIFCSWLSELPRIPRRESLRGSERLRQDHPKSKGALMALRIVSRAVFSDTSEYSNFPSPLRSWLTDDRGRLSDFGGLHFRYSLQLFGFIWNAHKL